jgi:hypothetical protein
MRVCQFRHFGLKNAHDAAPGLQPHSAAADRNCSKYFNKKGGGAVPDALLGSVHFEILWRSAPKERALTPAVQNRDCPGTPTGKPCSSKKRQTPQGLKSLLKNSFSVLYMRFAPTPGAARRPSAEWM